MDTDDRRDLVVSLASETCPHCDQTKRPRQTFCRARSIFEGYEKAFAAAIGHLRAAAPEAEPDSETKNLW